MQFIYITCNVSKQEPLRLLLNDLGFSEYQVIEKLTARSQWGEPREDTAVWPGFNISVLIQEPDPAKVDRLFVELSKLNGEAITDNELINAHVWPISQSLEVKSPS